ncbi:Oligopeptide transport ATP-binding protein OppF [bacterium HR24]|nr:Oligopeptide transport ATP-binding protein OppF [bacterium HR24]
MSLQTTGQTRPSETVGDNVLVSVRDVKMHFPVTAGILFQRRVGTIRAVDGVTFDIKRGETVGLVGESGCGKTTLGRCILMLYRPTSGRIVFEGQDLTAMKPGEIRRMRRRMQMIFQDPYASLNPRMTVGSIIAEPMIIHGLVKSRRERRERVEELMRVVGLNPFYANRYPHEFSGGQRQRIGIARALAVQPSFIVADEPVSALDVSIQAQIINLLEELQERFQLTYLFIAHDLSVVRHISNRVAVMYLGKVMELTDRDELYSNPLHPYTKALLSAVPVPDPAVEAKRERIILLGEIPSPMRPPPGCVFHTRCPIAIDECRTRVPEWRNVGTADRPHWVACHRVIGGKLDGWTGVKPDNAK